MKLGLKVALAAGVLGLVAANAWFWLKAPAASFATTPVQPDVQPVAVPPPAAAASPAMPIVQHPIDSVALAEPTAAPPDLPSAVRDLFGNKAVLALFQIDDLPRRVAATVDGLGRAHASSRLWPLNPAEGRFVVDAKGPSVTISPDNGLRYTPYVLLLETVDLRQVAAVYARFYGQFQQAYEDLGYPGQYFNDRLIAVMDQLLLTPDFTDPLRVHLPTANSPVQPQRPWVLYEFGDTELQAMTSGQRMLLRMGPVNERRIKAKLRELRRLLTTSAAPSAKK